MYIYIYIYLSISHADSHSFHGDFQVMRLSAAAGKLPPGAVLDGGWNETSDEGIYGRWRIKHGDYYGDLMVFHGILWWFIDGLPIKNGDFP